MAKQPAKKSSPADSDVAKSPVKGGEKKAAPPTKGATKGSAKPGKK